MSEKGPESEKSTVEPTVAALSSPLAPSNESLSINPWTSTDRTSPPDLPTHSSTTPSPFTSVDEEYDLDSDYGFDTDEDPLDEGECKHEKEDSNERAEDKFEVDKMETTVCCSQGFLPCLKQTAISILIFIRDIVRKIPRRQLIAAIAVAFTAMRTSCVSTRVDDAGDENRISKEDINADEGDADEVLTDLTNSVAKAVVDTITE